MRNVEIFDKHVKATSRDLMMATDKRLCFVLFLCCSLKFVYSFDLHLNQDSHFEDSSGEEEIMERGELKTGESPLAFSQETLERLALNPDIEVNIEVVNDNWHSNHATRTETPVIHYSGDGETMTEATVHVTQNGGGNEYLDVDHCEKWIGCRNEFLQIYLRQLKYLPGCPCHYPTDILYNEKIWDVSTSRYNRWRDASGASEKLSVYKPGAVYCIRSQVTSGKTGLAAQHCCYDRNRKLITRGRDAGTPNLVSPDVSKRLHYEVDVKPWIICKGDWTRYNAARPPDNRMNCTENPSDEVYFAQVKKAKSY